MASKKHQKTEPKHKPSTKRTLEDILTSLQDLAKNELARPGAESGSVQDDNQKTDKLEQDEPAGTDPEDGFQHSETIEMDMPKPQELASGQTGDIFEGLELLPENQISNPSEADIDEASGNEVEEIRWEDIPVLEDVAEGTDDEDEFQIPDPKQARKIAIQVAARLNIEMHKQGLEGLDIATINRLRALLVKELAKAAASKQDDEA